MNFGILAIFAIAVTCLHAGPIGKRSTGGATVEFQMPVSNYNNIQWGEMSPAMATMVSDSQNSFPDSDHKCPTQVLEGDSVPLYQRSTCPWYYAVNNDTNRFPAQILEARPACNFCIGTGYQCEPIRRSIHVLMKKSSSADVVEFEDAEVEIAVGYTCAGLRTVQNGTPTTAAPSADLPDFAK